jgi:beta-lactamase regulating signal transducer with metallopeptidase domain
MSIIHILGESAVRSLALALAVAIVLRVLRVQHARLAKRAWTAVLILALAMPALVALHIPSFSFTALWSTPRTVILPAVTAPLSAPDSLSLDAADTSSAIAATPAPPEDFAPAVILNVPVPTELQGAPQGALQTSPAPTRHIAWWQIGFAAYLAITTLLLLRVLLGLSLAARLWRRAQTFATSETDLPVRLSCDLRSPATVGRGILLPLEAIDWDEAALRATLAHEAQHVREGDFYLQLAATLHHCFFWISPHAWWLRPQLSRLSETICDRAAVASGSDGLSYAQLLIRFASAEQTPAGMLAMAQSAGLRERVERLIADPQLTNAFRHRRGQAIVAGALLATAGIVAAASIHIVQPATIVLAAPQAPAPPAPPQPPAAPAAPDAAPAPAAPDAAPAPAPVPPDAAIAPAPPPPLAPDAPPAPPAVAPDTPPAPPAAPDTPDSIHVGSGTGEGIGEGAGTDPSNGKVIHVNPRVHVKTIVVPSTDTQVMAIQDLDSVSPVVSVQPLTMVHPLIVMKHGTKILAIPQVEVVPPDTDGPIALNGRGYAIYGPDGDHMVMMHGWFGDADKLHDEQAKHPGGAILFRRDGKRWVIDDPALVKQAQEAYSHVSELGKQQGELGAKQGKLGAQQGELGALQGELGAKQGEWGDQQAKFAENFHFEMPKDFDKNIQDLTDSETRLAMDRDKMSQEQIAALEAENKAAHERMEKELEQLRAQQPQREAMEKQMREQTEQIRKQMEPMMKQMRELGAEQGELGRLQGELGRQQGMLGRQQREASREADSKVQSLIDQAMKNGKAHPVQ